MIEILIPAASSRAETTFWVTLPNGNLFPVGHTSYSYRNGPIGVPTAPTKRYAAICTSRHSSFYRDELRHVMRAPQETRRQVVLLEGGQNSCVGKKWSRSLRALSHRARHCNILYTTAILEVFAESFEQDLHRYMHIILAEASTAHSKPKGGAKTWVKSRVLRGVGE